MSEPGAAEADGRTGAPVPGGHLPQLVPPALAAWLTALVLLEFPAATGLAVAGAVGTAAGALWAGSRSAGARAGRWRRTALACLCCVAATALVVGIRVHTVATGPVAKLAAAGATVRAEVVLTGDPRLRVRREGMVHRQRVVVEGTMETVEAGGRRLEVRAPVVLFGSGEVWRPLLPSQRIAVHGRLAPGETAELTTAIMLVRGPPTVLSGPSALQEAAGELRAGLREAAAVLPPDQAGLLPALVAGDVSRQDEQVKADFERAGLSHLTAVSGANLAIVSGAVLVLARLLGLRLPVRAALAAAAMVGFAVVARPSPSVLRALVMGVIAAVALGTGRSRDGLTALAAAVLGLVLFDPTLARSFGFALSVLATGGILLLAPRWRDRLARRMPRLLAEAIAVPAAAQAAVTPVLVLMLGRLEPVAVPANLLAGPAVAPATVLGFAAAVVAPVSMDLAQLIVRPAGLAVGWIILVAERAAALPGAVLPWPGGAHGLLLLAGAALTAWLLARRRLLRSLALAGTAGVLVAVLGLRPVLAPWPPPGWLLVACDVGQGDALVLAAGEDRAVVVDTGGDPVLADRCLRELGVRRIPLLVLTHPHADHIGGLSGVLRRRQVGAVLVSPHRGTGRGGAWVSADLARRRTPEWTAAPGTRWRFGPAELTVLGPDPAVTPAGGGEGTAVNNASVVLHVRWRAGTALLGGDLESEAQARLRAHGVPRADILKVPHHGAASQDAGFLAAVRPRAALISVGRDNDYGHPAPRTLALLTALGARVHRTDRSGHLAVVARDGRLEVTSRGR